MVLKSKPKLSLKFILKRCKTYKIMKGSKNNMGINPSKSYIIKSTVRNIVSGYRIDILNAKSVGKGLLNVFITETFIE